MQTQAEEAELKAMGKHPHTASSTARRKPWLGPKPVLITTLFPGIWLLCNQVLNVPFAAEPFIRAYAYPSAELRMR